MYIMLYFHQLNLNASLFINLRHSTSTNCNKSGKKSCEERDGDPPGAASCPERREMGDPPEAGSCPVRREMGDPPEAGSCPERAVRREMETHLKQRLVL